MRVLRYILTSPAQFEMMLEVKVDLLVARSLDTPPVRDIERLQAMRFIRQVGGIRDSCIAIYQCWTSET